MPHPTHMRALERASHTASPALELVVFTVGLQEYGLPVRDVAEVIPIPKLIHLGGVSAQLAGLINLRGTMLPVLDGGIVLGEQARYDLSSQIVIIRSLQNAASHPEPRMGLVVDCVTGVRQCSPSEVTPLVGVAAAVLQGVAKYAQGAVIMLDTAALLALSPELAGVGALA